MKKTLFLIFVCCFLAGSTANASIIVEFNSDPGAATVLNQANAGQDQTVSLGSGVTAGTGLDYIGVSSVSDLGTPFTFDVAISPTGNSTGVVVAGNNGSLVQTAVSQFATGEGLSISISNISDPNIVLDGFTNFGTDFSGTGEGFTIGGITYLRGTATNGDNDPRRGINLPGAVGTTPGLLAGSSAQVDFNGTSVGLRGFAIQFTDNTVNVPEPSSAVLLGLAGLGLLGRRRR